MGSRDTELLDRLTHTDAAVLADVATQRVSVVLRVDAACSVVADGARTRALARAASCALEPEPGDRVAWLDLGERGGFVCAVLERAAASPQRWSTPGGVAWHTPSLSVQAQQVQVDAADMAVRTQRASIVFDALQSVGRALTLTAQHVRLVGEELSTVFHRVVQHAQHHTRSVEGMDRLQAGTIDHRADTLLNLQAENVLANGDRLVKVRGAQIHLG